MPKFRIKFERNVNQVAIHEVEAESLNAADEIADQIQGGEVAVDLQWIDDDEGGHDYKIQPLDPPPVE